MIDIVVVLRAEDAVLDFLSVLTDDRGGETRVVLGDHAETVTLPAGSGPAERLALLAPYVRPAPREITSPEPAVLAGLVRDATAEAGRAVRVWTHSPADNRRGRGRLGRDTAAACESAGAGNGPGLEVRHAVGYSPYLQFVSDLDRPLGQRRIEAKLGFVNHSCGHLLTEENPEYLVQTPHIPATERFFDADPDQRERLYALLASLDDEAASVVDPWEFATSPYEAERLDATAAWVRNRCPAAGSTLVEVGACEGALTRRLAAAGFTVRATEPNPVFRPRLAAALAGADAVTVDEAGLAELAKEDTGPRADAHLLIEMFYYGQDPALLDDLATDCLFVALEPEALGLYIRPWLERSAHWRAEEEVVLVPPRVETVCSGRAYLSKRGSVGLLLRRTTS
ncbi:hypothetical protein [Streptomyces sp. AK02-01A]|uniref:hypothetical protein n=1 Tax=Streptomyces sp. AK02-01A TaxID=3028648 RepID=UPI0029A37CDC|nr:hypothetical protein [Streptomyces sp. AK02-01A]MDX3852417.1 SAM-dependent methyltransferase [Streptomyces sp. AK02-01A]